MKPLKKTSPLLHRMFLLIFAMVCGIYIVSICVKQISRSRIDEVQTIGGPFPQSAITEMTVPLVHYPVPITFNRYHEQPFVLSLDVSVSMFRAEIFSSHFVTSVTHELGYVFL